jgi:hypothetical protein
MEKLPKDHFVQQMRFTKSVFQDVYPSIDPTKPELSLAGKVAIVTGASRGIGARVRISLSSLLPVFFFLLPSHGSLIHHGI